MKLSATALAPQAPLAQPARAGARQPPTALREPLLKKALKDWHASEQPRERLMEFGPEALATSELIAILLRSGTRRHSAIDVARDLLQRCGGQLRNLGQLDYKSLAESHGMGPVKAVTLRAALELGRRTAHEADEDRPHVQTAARAYDLLAPVLRDLPHEECWVLLLDVGSKLIARERLSVGSLDSTIVDVRSVMSCALRHKAAGYVIAHNHPSHTASPSRADIEITRRLRAAGDIMQIRLQDHLIVAGRRYYSFREAKKLD